MAQPKKIVSLVPSLTELLVDFGLREAIAGRTRFCVHPGKAVEDIPIVGGTKNPRIDKIADLGPDLVIANREENRKEDIETLREFSDVRVTDISTIEDALLAIYRLGKSLGRTEQASKLISDIHSALNDRPDEPPLRTAYFIWKEPWMSVGGDTYIHDVMKHWGLQNVLGDRTRYPAIPLEELQYHDPELILLSSEPYPFREKHLSPVTDACPSARVLLVEGEWFSWYGSRMKEAFQRLNVWRKAIA